MEALAKSRTQDAAGEIRRIVVFGGGVSGWLAALAGVRQSRSQREVIVIETPAERALQVGEATAAGFPALVGRLGIDPRLFMERCSVTPRLATRLDGWAGAASVVWRPFASEPLTPRYAETLRRAACLRRLERPSPSLADVLPPVRLCRSGAVPSPRSLAVLAHGVHLDAESLTQLARGTAARLGIRQLFGLVKAVHLDATSGDIASVDIGGDRAIEADLFIDATADGTLARAGGDEWIAWPDVPCDRVVALPLPRDPEPACLTLSTAASAGHIWRLPLVHRTGLGYSYSGASMSDGDATEMLVAAAGLRRRRTADPRRVTFAPGRRALAWCGNRLAVGAAACRLDPILAPELGILQDGLEALGTVLGAAGLSLPERRDRYNDLVDAALRAMRDDVRLAYAISARGEPFWEAARRGGGSGSLVDKLRGYDDINTHDSGVVSVAEACMLASAGRFPLSFAASEGPSAPEDLEAALEREIEEADRDLATWQAAN